MPHSLARRGAGGLSQGCLLRIFRMCLTVAPNSNSNGDNGIMMIIYGFEAPIFRQTPCVQAMPHIPRCGTKTHNRLAESDPVEQLTPRLTSGIQTVNYVSFQAMRSSGIAKPHRSCGGGEPPAGPVTEVERKSGGSGIKSFGSQRGR